MTTPQTEFPRILILDDAFDVGSDIRRDSLDALALCDRSSSPQADSSDYLAGVDVCTGMLKGKFSPEELRHQLIAFGHRKWALVLVDFYFSDPDGDVPRAKQIIDILRNEFHVDEDIFILFSASPKDAATLKQLGCKGSLPKPTKTDLRNGTTAIYRRALGKLLFENGFIADGPVRYVTHAGTLISRNGSEEELFFGDTPATFRALRKARRALVQWAATGFPILIEGRSGDGKAQLGKYIHRWGEAALEYAESKERKPVGTKGCEFRVISSGEIGAAFLNALLLRGKFPAMGDLLDGMSFDTILHRELASFDAGTLGGLLRLYSAKPPILKGLHLFTTSYDKTELVDSGRVDPNFFSQVFIELNVPPIGLRRDSDRIFVHVLNKKRLEMHLSDDGSLAPSALDWLQAQTSELTFRQLEEMASVIAEWQAGNPGVKNNHQVEQPLLEQSYLQTRRKYQQRTGFKGLLHRIKTYNLSQDDNVQDGLEDLKKAIYPLFFKILDRASSECKYVESTGLHLGVRRGDPQQQGNLVRKYFKGWFDVLGLDEDHPYRIKFTRGTGRKST